MTRKNDRQIGLRMPKDLLNQVDQYAEQLSRTFFDMPVSRCMAIRKLIADGLDRVERKKK